MSEDVTEEFIEKVEAKIKKVRAFDYKNIGSRNIFTTKGRCAPGQTVNLKSDEAKAYEGLKKC